MSKTTADQIRAYLMGQGISVPGDNRKLFDEMQAHNVIECTPDNTAIWHCQLTADSGWKPKDKFSLLLIKPEIVWDNVDDRPELFAGTIDIINMEKMSKGEAVIANIDAIHKIENEQSFVENTIVVQSNEESEKEIKNGDGESIDFVLNMFSDNTVLKSSGKGNAVIESEVKSATTEPEQLDQSTSESQGVALISQQTESVSLSGEGQQFVDWLKDKLLNEKLTFNDRAAKVHIVDNCLFLVSPSSFELYLAEKGRSYTEETINSLQYEFQALGLHKKKIIGNDSTNFWKCRVIGPRKNSFLVGYLVPNPKLFFGDKILINNRHLSLEE